MNHQTGESLHLAWDECEYSRRMLAHRKFPVSSGALKLSAPETPEARFLCAPEAPENSGATK